MSSFGGEIRLALRRLRRTPFFTSIVLLTLAIGIGANTAIFAVVNGVLLAPLPYPDSDRLMGVWHKAPGAGFDQLEMSLGTYLIYRELGGAVFEDVGMWHHDEFTIASPGEPERVLAVRITEGLLPILGVEPILGRSFDEADTKVDAPLVVLLTYGYWQRKFGGAADVLEQTVRVNGRETEIVGVLPRDLRLSSRDASIYVPFTINPADASAGGYSHFGIARLTPGATVAGANAEIDRLIPSIADRYPGGLTLEQLRDVGFAANVHPYAEDVIGNIGDVLWVLLGSVGLLLVIACANVANLFVVRAEGRTRDVAVRTAMGASRARIAREFLTESVLLGLAGGFVGLGLAFIGTRILVRTAPDSLPRLDNIAIAPAVVLFAVAISVLSGLLFGALPLLRLHALNLLAALREGGRGASAGRHRHRVRNGLVVAQVSLALVLLSGSGLMLRTFVALRAVHPGFSEAADVLTFSISIPGSEVPNDTAAARIHERIIARIAALPGVREVAAASELPMSGNTSNDVVELEAFPTAPGELPPVRRIGFVTPGYFATLNTPLVAGRTIEWRDVHEQRHVVLVSESFTRAHWSDPGQAVGQRLRASFGESWFEIVGVHRDIRLDGLNRDAPPAVYFPYAVRDLWGADLLVRRNLAYVVRASGAGALTLVTAARNAIRDVNPNLPLANVRTLQQITDASMTRTSFTLVLLAIAAAVALGLGAIGVYAVLTWIVLQRTREIGVRIALGAKAADVRNLVLRQGLTITGLGLVIGLLTAALLTRLMSTLLFGITPFDPPTFGVVAAAIGLVAMAASAVPAWRAARLDPIDALRRD